MEPQQNPNQAEPPPVSARPNSGEPTGGSYRHDVDLRFVTPPWLGRIYFDLRMGRDVRGRGRPLALPRSVRRHNRYAAAVLGQMLVSWIAALVVLAAWLSQIGCGSQVAGPGLDDGDKNSGGIQVSVVWPEASAKMIPAGAESILLVVVDKATGEELGRGLLTRAISTTAIAGLPAGRLCTVTATAHPNADGTGTAQAAASQDITIPENQNAELNLSLASTIVAVEVTPSTADKKTGELLALTATATDAEGNVVLVDASKWQWVSDDPSIARVEAPGQVALLLPGSVTVRATDLESGKVGVCQATITAAPFTPVISVTGSPCSVGGTISLDVEADSVPTDVATAEWDFDGDGTYERTISGSIATSVACPVAGSKTVHLRVTAQSGAVGEATVAVTVNPRAGGVVRLESIGTISATNISDNNMPVCSSLDGTNVFAMYTTPQARTVVAMRPPHAGDAWPTIVLDPTTKLDGWHDGPTVICDGEDYVHCWVGVHNTDWKYYRSVQPVRTVEDFNAGFADVSAELPPGEITYPRAWTDAQGDVYFTWRDRGANNGGRAWFGFYDASAQTWRTTLLFDDQTVVSGAPFPFTTGKLPLAIGPDGRIHTVALWSNQSLGCDTAWDPTYAYSDDQGITWRRSDGSAYDLPIRHETGNPQILVARSVMGAIMTPASVAVERDGTVHVLVTEGKDPTFGWGLWRISSNGSSWSPRAFVNNASPYGVSTGPASQVDQIAIMTTLGTYFGRSRGTSWSFALADYGSSDNQYVRWDGQGYGRSGVRHFLVPRKGTYELFYGAIQ